MDYSLQYTSPKMIKNKANGNINIIAAILTIIYVIVFYLPVHPNFYRSNKNDGIVKKSMM
jgi:hypothetical protein